MPPTRMTAHRGAAALALACMLTGLVTSCKTAQDAQPTPSPARSTAQAASRAAASASASKAAASRAKAAASKAAAAATASAAAEAERVKAATSYVGKIDGPVQDANKVIGLFGENEPALSPSHRADAATAAGNVISAENFFSTASGEFQRATAPDSAKLPKANVDLAEAMAQYEIACKDYLQAIDTLAPSAVARYKQDVALARSMWVKVLQQIYGAANKPAPLPQA